MHNAAGTALTTASRSKRVAEPAMLAALPTHRPAMLYLASQSPRRRELLQQLGVAYQVLDVDVPEQRAAGESPEAYVSRVARDKAQAGLALLGEGGGAVVLGSDTEVVLDGEVFGKPAGAEQAAAMLRRLSGRSHAVVSAVWCVDARRAGCEVCVSTVRFASLDEATIAAYVATGEPFGKAGAYAIQGRGAALVEHLEGSYSGVMGLPLFETARLLRSFGVVPD
jgi:septum formation protein